MAKVECDVLAVVERGERLLMLPAESLAVGLLGQEAVEMAGELWPADSVTNTELPVFERPMLTPAVEFSQGLVDEELALVR